MSDTTIGHTNHDEETATENLREFVENTADADDLARLVSLVLDGDIVTVTMNNGATSQPFHDGHLLTAGWRIVMVGEKGIEGETLYWSNDEGWVGRESATLFTNDEREIYPSIPQGGKWEYAHSLNDRPTYDELASALEGMVVEWGSRRDQQKALDNAIEILKRLGRDHE
tara:strand:- start:260 stop:769 length:510 start_codon:yes stop_codon:yes gene_type:complete